MINNDLTGSLSWLNNRPLYASISGGKDSTALGLFLMDKGIKFTPLFIDTGFEHEATYEYINDVLAPVFGSFTVIRNEKYFIEGSDWAGGMEQIIKENRMFPSGVAKFCTRLLKIVPIQNFYAEIRRETKKKPVNAIGIRAEESKKRSLLGEKEEQDEATVWRPLIHIKEDEVIQMHNAHNMPPNPLYLKGASRVGCYPCIYARKHEIRHMSFDDPERIVYLSNLENRVNALRSDKQRKATFFKSRAKDRAPMDINDIVKWSRRKKGYELDDLELIEEQGCMRWGLCDPPIREGDQLSLF